ncbi:MAG: 2,3-bisphosphoglycerate-independent phosphoglycerate mutase [Gammaproteobacteria bacterium]|nr:2,3-bisphosphoglycerate-independent phosphoglycerate mutase [Gammaproteobacteria bacterium]
MTSSHHIQRPRPFALIILDGWGYRENPANNAIAAAHKPCWDQLWQQYSHTLLSGSGRCVGLPEGQMGNSEVGHLNIGAGRTIYQDLTRIENAISTGEFFSNPILIAAIQQAISHDKAIHLAGLLSPGGVHSHENQFKAMIDLAAQQGAKKVYIHAFLDGRDTPPKSAYASLEKISVYCAAKKCGKIISLIGRYFAMDRDKRWERTEKAWALMVEGKAAYHAKDALSALAAAYERGETDEFVSATSIHPENTMPECIQEGDSIIFMNFRADRVRQLTQALTDPAFKNFPRPIFPKVHCTTLTNYNATFDLPVAFPSDYPKNILGQYLSELGWKQLRIAETEKYAHVTFFFNGGIETPFPGEDRILIPSPKVATYDEAPDMSAYTLTDKLVEAIKQQKYDVIICNFANPDMVGHTGNLPATIQAIETIDKCLARIVQALKEVGGEALITADHGNAEMLLNEDTGQPHTAHTNEPVPLLYVGRPAKVTHQNGTLADITPTMLYLLGIPKPEEMTGKTLLKL